MLVSVMSEDLSGIPSDGMADPPVDLLAQANAMALHPPPADNTSVGQPVAQPSPQAITPPAMSRPPHSPHPSLSPVSISDQHPARMRDVEMKAHGSPPPVLRDNAMEVDEDAATAGARESEDAVDTEAGADEVPQGESEPAPAPKRKIRKTVKTPTAPGPGRQTRSKSSELAATRGLGIRLT